MTWQAMQIARSSPYDDAMTASAQHPGHPMQRLVPRPFGDHLRHWRQHRRPSQLALAQKGDISTRSASAPARSAI